MGVSVKAALSLKASRPSQKTPDYTAGLRAKPDEPTMFRGMCNTIWFSEQSRLTFREVRTRRHLKAPKALRQVSRKGPSGISAGRAVRRVETFQGGRRGNREGNLKVGGKCVRIDSCHVPMRTEAEHGVKMGLGCLRWSVFSWCINRCSTGEVGNGKPGLRDA